jgi:hypothetical protein
MPRVIKRFQRMRINRQINTNRKAITASRAADPEGFGSRESLYMRHHELLEQREGLGA